MLTVAEDQALFAFDNSYARLPDRLFARVLPAEAPAPELLLLNQGLADELGLDPDRLAGRDGVDVLAGNRVAPGSEPIAMAYAGHQFGGWVPQLGDGRALLLGEVIDRQGRRRDIQLKGSGRTPFSRSGDGKAPLGPVLREFIVSEAMAALGIPTTRSLAAVATGAPVQRQITEPGAVLTRVAASHIRIGTFQYFYARNDHEALRALTDHALARHYPDAAIKETPALTLLETVLARQADLVAGWMGVGFIHGVMNTDNMTISGETIDFGPCAFMDVFREDQVFSSIDTGGRYAYGNQPRIAHWNLAQLAQALLPLIADARDEAIEAAQAVINRFPELYRTAWRHVMRRKLGLTTAHDDDVTLIDDLLSTMEAQGADFTLTFRGLADLVTPGNDGTPPVRTLFKDPEAFDAWAPQWTARLADDSMAADARASQMRATNPLFIPRNHRVAEALAAAEAGDVDPLHTLWQALTTPFDAQPDAAHLAQPPGPNQAVLRTFCGT